MRLTTSLSEITVLAAPADVLELGAVTGAFSVLHSPPPFSDCKARTQPAAKTSNKKIDLLLQFPESLSTFQPKSE